MSRTDKLAGSLPEILPQLFAAYSNSLATHDAEKIKGLFSDQAKLTIDKRVMGPDDIATHLIKLNCEFKAEEYSWIIADHNEVLVSGICTWCNERRPFTMVLQFPSEGDILSGKISVTNHMILAK